MYKSTYEKFITLPLTERIGLIGLYFFLFFAWESKARAAISFLFVLIPCLIDRRFWGDIGRSRIFWVLFIFFIYISIRAIFAVNENPDLRSYHLQDSWELMLLGGFIFVGWLLRGDQSRIILALTVSLIGFWIGRLEHFPWSDAIAGMPWWTMRHDFGLPSAIGFGLYSAAATLGLFIMAPRIWSVSKQPLIKILARSAWVILLLISIEGVIVSKTRGVWLSLAILAIVLIATNFHLLTSRRPPKSKTIVPLLLGSCLVIALGYLNYATVEKRLFHESETTSNILNGKFDQIEALDHSGVQKSIGTRYHMLLFGFEHWKKNIFFGLGPGITKPLIQKKWELGHEFTHLHSNYLEMLLRLGVTGTTLIFLLLSLIVFLGLQAYRDKRVDRDVFMLLTTALTLALLLSFSSFRMLHADWRYYWFLIGGALFSLSLSSGNHEETKG